MAVLKLAATSLCMTKFIILFFPSCYLYFTVAPLKLILAQWLVCSWTELIFSKCIGTHITLSYHCVLYVLWKLSYHCRELSWHQSKMALTSKQTECLCISLDAKTPWWLNRAQSVSLVDLLGRRRWQLPGSRQSERCLIIVSHRIILQVKYTIFAFNTMLCSFPCKRKSSVLT